MLKGKFNNINSFGDFINALIALAIGIAGIFTVGAIMWDGVTYWRASGEGNTSKMTAVKGRIWKRMLGLLLVLSIYTVLRTINPDLLNLTPNINFAALSPDEKGDGSQSNSIPSDQSANIGTTNPKACPAGLTKVQQFIVCKSIETKLAALLNAATTDGITLGGGGFRTYDQQVALRKSNCGTDDYSIFKKPANDCTPPTAPPGTSRHESGLAFDFTCNGHGTINLTTNASGSQVCFDWLKANAGTYGLRNYPAENWHWSVDGH